MKAVCVFFLRLIRGVLFFQDTWFDCLILDQLPISGQWSTFIPSEKRQKTRGFLKFLGVIEVDHWLEMS